MGVESLVKDGKSGLDEGKFELKVSRNVVELLKQNPELRNDDRLLCFEYWRSIDKADIALPAQPITSPATIIRMRQKLQNKGKFLPTDPEVAARRQKQEAKIRSLIEE